MPVTKLKCTLKSVYNMEYNEINVEKRGCVHAS